MRREPAIIMTQHAGAVESRVNRRTGTVVTIYNTKEADLDLDAGRWTLICEDHDQTLGVDSRRCARSWMPAPENFCSECAKLVEAGHKVEVG